ncbi:MAG: helix-turn-helix domain-containing protein [Verrucomicrobia bacterium]|nr:helix-turn-helix domain-containing protein [Verrucomicrobiota bacterium]
MSSDEIMTLEEVARYLKLKPQTVYKWAQEGQIPGAKLGKEWRFRRGILDEWIDSSIILSRGGMDLLVRSGQAAIQNKGLTADELERLLNESMDPPSTGSGVATPPPTPSSP